MKACRGPWNVPLDEITHRDKEGSNTPDRVPPDDVRVLEGGCLPAWVTSGHLGHGQGEARGRGWQRCRKECLEKSEKLLSCTFLAKPPRMEPFPEEILQHAELLKGQGRVLAYGGECPFTGLPYLRQSPAWWHSHVSGESEKFHFQSLPPTRRS